MRLAPQHGAQNEAMAGAFERRRARAEEVQKRQRQTRHRLLAWRLAAFHHAREAAPVTERICRHHPEEGNRERLQGRV